MEDDRLINWAYNSGWALLGGGGNPKILSYKCLFILGQKNMFIYFITPIDQKKKGKKNIIRLYGEKKTYRNLLTTKKNTYFSNKKKLSHTMHF